MVCKICIGMAIYGPESIGNHHHKMCPKYKTGKFPYLFYYEEAENCFIPTPERIENIISVPDSLDKDDEFEIKFRRFDYTDEEFDALPLS